VLPLAEFSAVLLFWRLQMVVCLIVSDEHWRTAGKRGG
jgi:hypothetical protein